MPDAMKSQEPRAFPLPEKVGRPPLLRAVSVAATLYFFLVSINLLGTGFRMLGAGFAEQLIATTSNPLVGLFIGILATSVVQSSSMTTSMTVGFVASGVLTIEGAIPIVMGANVGTTVTCAIVSMGHLGRKEEFRRAFAAASVHDFFNLIAVAVLFPLELATGFLSRVARWLTGLLTGGEAVSFASPVKEAVAPIVGWIVKLTEAAFGSHAAIPVVVLSLVLLFGSLYILVRHTKALAAGRAEILIDKFIGRSGLAGMAVGAGMTAVIQSSSVTTSLLVPLAGAGIVKLEKVFPVTLGANIGTTVTALLASLAGDARGLTIALVHLLFNLAGILVVYPFRPVRKVPLLLARRLADAAVRSRRNALFFVLGLFYALPALLVLIDRLI
ncbi:MAG: sodium dependent phosphate transporter [Candidatus Eisenbacteria bacterium]|nr:sodium dependent phosphate transporter [Candidatus Eisenbacteria bacterium]